MSKKRDGVENKLDKLIKMERQEARREKLEARTEKPKGKN